MKVDSGIIADGTDGIRGLRRRERTRLWFRTLPAVETIPDHLRRAIELAPHPTVTAPDLVESDQTHAVSAGTDLLVGEWLIAEQGDAVLDVQPALTTTERQDRIRRRLGTQLDAPLIDPEPTPARPEPLTDWRMVPRNGPRFVLSATEVLDGRRPGPRFGPGCRYRVFSAAEGIAGLEVMQADGAIAAGYCNAVDLICVEPMLVNLAGGGRKFTTKQRFRQGLSQVTNSLSGLMS